VSNNPSVSNNNPSVSNNNPSVSNNNPSVVVVYTVAPTPGAPAIVVPASSTIVVPPGSNITVTQVGNVDIIQNTGTVPLVIQVFSRIPARSITGR
ncbi:MAG: hypothetical protein JRM85_08045, partial [Nitrososphaerota archaeon]|nr:hypothetical protein [Nitrososphaerota archaeon]